MMPYVNNVNKSPRVSLETQCTLLVRQINKNKICCLEMSKKALRIPYYCVIKWNIKQSQRVAPAGFQLNTVQQILFCSAIVSVAFRTCHWSVYLFSLSVFRIYKKVILFLSQEAPIRHAFKAITMVLRS